MTLDCVFKQLLGLCYKLLYLCFLPEPYKVIRAGKLSGIDCGGIVFPAHFLRHSILSGEKFEFFRIKKLYENKKTLIGVKLTSSLKLLLRTINRIDMKNTQKIFGLLPHRVSMVSYILTWIREMKLSASVSLLNRGRI